jgi:uncharacterized protein (DUF58 family)
MIPPHVIRELRYLEIVATKKLRALRLGPYTSPARGPGFDFHQHLPYRPGDDVRRIDWNVTARLNAPYTRQTHAERELDVILAIDLSRSMEIGAGRYSKKEAMTLIAASLLFSAVSDHMNTGALAFTDRVLTWSPPRHTSGRAWQILHEIWALEPERPRTAILPAVRQMTSRLKAMSVLFLLSDFVTDEDLFGSAEMRILAARHDVILVVVEDPVELALPPGRGFLRVRDVERGADTVVGVNDRSRHAYTEAVAQRRQAIMDACYRLSMDHVFVRADQPIMEPLFELFARRRIA